LRGPTSKERGREGRGREGKGSGRQEREREGRGGEGKGHEPPPHYLEEVYAYGHVWPDSGILATQITQIY